MWPENPVTTDRDTIEATELLINPPVASQQPAGVDDIQYYRISYRPMMPNGWWAEWWFEVLRNVSVGSGDSQTAFRLGGLVPSSKYQIRVTAYNKNGVPSWPSAAIDAMTRSRGRYPDDR